ncbi:MAG: hypothetical protein HZC44_01330 [Geobacter sp.]|nr:hypothetical protein [Geobacter sp.]
MMLLLSGEGPSDIGTCYGGVPPCEGAQFKAGPMAVIIDQLAEQKLNYSLIDNGSVRFVGEHEVAVRSKSISAIRSLRLPGEKVKTDTIYFRKNAQALGVMAKELETERECPVVTVLFRDSDGSNSSTRSLWKDKFNSIVHGFKDAEFERGAPMVPKPKSEAWLMCALKDNPYTHCTALEEESGNDASPISLKRQLAAIIGDQVSSEDLAEWVREGRIDPGRIGMPSFDAFRFELDRALDNALAH